MGQQPLAPGREADVPPLAGEEFLSEEVLEPFYLLADGRLGEVQQLSRTGHTTGFRDGHESPN